MKTHYAIPLLILTALLTFSTGCLRAPGRPKPYAEAVRPEQVHDFTTLYEQNCAACHGEHGEQGASISLANPTYLAFAGINNIERVTANGVPHTLMPAFSKQAGGSLTDEQISTLAHGMVQAWNNLHDNADQHTPPYASTLAGDPATGQKAFQSNCAHCHGDDALGNKTERLHTGSLVDPTYLALVSDQSLRSTIIAGRLADRMPDWRSDADGPESRPMTDQEITDIVSWLVTRRSATPGQPYPQHP